MININKIKDSCCLSSNEDICLVKSINNEEATVEKFTKKISLFLYPLNSKILNMYFVSKHRKYCKINRKHLHKKCFMIPKENGYAIIPLL